MAFNLGFFNRSAFGGSAISMQRFFKGAGVGTYLHREELAGRGPQVFGIPPVRPGGGRALVDLIAHIVYGTRSSPCVSLTKSFAIARNYALAFGKTWPTSATPAFIYTVDIPNPLPRNPGYGVSPSAFAHYRMALTRRAGAWATPRPANLTLELEAMVRAMRDAEVLILGHVPSGCVTDIQPVY